MQYWIIAIGVIAMAGGIVALVVTLASRRRTKRDGLEAARRMAGLWEASLKHLRTIAQIDVMRQRDAEAFGDQQITSGEGVWRFLVCVDMLDKHDEAGARTAFGQLRVFAERVEAVARVMAEREDARRVAFIRQEFFRVNECLQAITSSKANGSEAHRAAFGLYTEAHAAVTQTSDWMAAGHLLRQAMERIEKVLDEETIDASTATRVVDLSSITARRRLGLTG